MRIAPVDGATFYWSPRTFGFAVSGVTGWSEIVGRLLVLATWIYAFLISELGTPEVRAARPHDCRQDAGATFGLTKL
jgi:hypothetical protein